MAWVVPCAHGTPTIRLWSFDVRSERPLQATLVGGEPSKLGVSVDKCLITRKNHAFVRVRLGASELKNVPETLDCSTEGRRVSAVRWTRCEPIEGRVLSRSA